MRRFAILLAAALVVLAIGYTIVWFVAAGKVESALDAALAREAAAGRVWTCPQRRVDGFPKQMQVTCLAPTFKGRLGGQEASGRIGGLIGLARLWQPNHIVFDLQGPLVAERADGARLELAWSAARIGLRGLPGSFERVSLIAEDLRVAASGLAAPPAAERLELHLRSAPRPAEGRGVEHAADLAVKVSGGQWAPLERFVKTQGPIEIDAQLRASRATALLRPGALAARLEAWRQADGQLDVSQLIARRGAARIDGTAILALDGEHRLAGNADLTATGLNETLAALGVPQSMLSLGAGLGALLGKKTGAPAGALPLPLRFERGGVFLGPAPLPVKLAPLY